MRIEEDLKLGFKDVLIRPKRSTLKSRSDVELERQFTFKHSGQSWSGVPIIAANMDTVGTFSMASALASFDILTAVHKHYSVEEWQAFINNSSADVLKHVMVSTGTSDADFEKTKQILDLNPALNFVCFDASCTNRTWANANFNDIGTGEDKLLTHFTSHYVACTNGFGRPRFTRFRNELHEVFGITIRHVNTNEI